MPLTPEVVLDCDEVVAGQSLRLKVVQIGGTYVARFDNVDPGAVIARGRGPTLEQAVEDARASARVNLSLSGARAHLRDLLSKGEA